MIEGLKPYAEYKESGLKWLGKLPDHWAVLPLCRVAAPKSECGRPDLELLSVYLHRGVIRYSESGGQVHKPSTDLSKYQVVEPGDFVLNNQQAWRGSIGVSKHKGIISPAYVVMRLRPKLSPGFANYLFRSPAMVAQFVVASRGVGDIQRNLYYPDLRGSSVVVPPPDEQTAIVRFLDHANRKIDGFIRAKRKLIGLLNEQKQAIIHRAVTSGLHPDVTLKPSGIPWLGDIPQHWDVMRISRFAKVGNGSTPSRSNMGFWSGGTYPWLNSSHVNRGFIDSADQFVTFSALRECHLPKVAAGSVLIAITGQGKTRGTSAVLGFEATINQHIAYITPRIPVVTAKYLHLSLVAAYSTLRSISDDSGSTKGALTCEDLKRFKLAVPPIDEQEQLVEAIATETKAANTTIARTEREIALMQEYRTRLTADLVTGKLDVREAAAKLPAEPAAEEALEEQDGENSETDLDE